MTTGTPVGSGIISTPVKFDITQATPSSVYYGTGQGLPYSKEADAWVNKGVSIGLLGRFEEAIARFETALKINPLNACA